MNHDKIVEQQGKRDNSGNTFRKAENSKEGRLNQQELIEAIRHGDTAAFESLYNYGDSIIRFLTRIVGNVEDAKEITQDAYVLVWQQRDTINPHSSLQSYVGGIAKNLALQHLRTIKARCAANNEVFYSSQSDVSDLADDYIITKETELLIKAAIRRMPAQRRRVFEMSREEGLTYNEIAEKLNISYGTVRTHIELAKSELRSMLSVLIAALMIL